MAFREETIGSQLLIGACILSWFIILIGKVAYFIGLNIGGNL